MFLRSIQPQQVKCKCCENTAELYDVCDFSKNCEEIRGVHLPVMGVPIYYYKCQTCGFIFTRDIDHLTHQAIQDYIYNDEYITIDPDYIEKRPAANANLIHSLFEPFKEQLKIMDYGGGNGLLEEKLRGCGFKNIKTYDPFYHSFAEKPSGLYNVITSFEVMEHVSDPLDTFNSMLSLLDKDNGIVMFSTLLQPNDIDKLKTKWWYICPRNGHISIYQLKTLQFIASKFGFIIASANNNLHFLYKKIPSFCTHFIK